MDKKETLKRVPSLQKDYLEAAVFEPESQDIDVNALHHGFLKGLRKLGGQILNEHALEQAYRSGNSWVIHAGKIQIHAEPILYISSHWESQVFLNMIK